MLRVLDSGFAWTCWGVRYPETVEVVEQAAVASTKSENYGLLPSVCVLDAVFLVGQVSLLSPFLAEPTFDESFGLWV